MAEKVGVCGDCGKAIANENELVDWGWVPTTDKNVKAFVCPDCLKKLKRRSG